MLRAVIPVRSVVGSGLWIREEPMRPVVWRPPTEPSPAEQAVIKVVQRGKPFVFLRAAPEVERNQRLPATIPSPRA